ncbi:RNA polymerase 2 [Alcaligenes phage vB_Af_QDWS595]|uniref:RNA polymerase 2 n=1 Tax=Alcaligenes phage vB_Af_QDWS595 TaxID=2877946 RepID=A0AAE8Y1M8_9CAUD|nr:RNA polymerase 2 [Alcaligenes phage vB_Af_QDWS595]UCR75542.1 RNA polymerase 2 [Alcaligenes phage vB_Af_QDWS595]
MAFQQFTGMQYLKMDIAARHSMDKENWEDRLNWYEENQNQLMNVVGQAEEPAQYVAAVKSMFEVKQGLASGYPISLDATSSGLQILAAITNDAKAAALCNVIDIGYRADAYKIIFEFMKEVLGSSANIERGDTKDAIMTALYGSEAQPKRVFGEGTPMLHCFYETMKSKAPAAWAINEAFRNMWNPEKTINSWVLPDNFHVHVKVIDTIAEDIRFLDEPHTVMYKVNQAMPDGRSLGANSIHSLDGMIVREIGRRCNYDPKQLQLVLGTLNGDEPSYINIKDSDVEMAEKLWNHHNRTGYLSARILDYVNPETLKFMDANRIHELILSMPKRPFQVIMVHDCFRCLPNYGNDLRKQYNIQLWELAKSSVLSSIVSQIIGKDVNVGKQDPYMVNSILEANYALA